MQDLVALGTGNSRLMKSNIPSNTTLQQLIQMLNNGTFPYDIGPLNAAGISQQGTPLNKANLLSDVTAALLGGVNTPDAAFAFLGKYNQYWWKRSTVSGEQAQVPRPESSLTTITLRTRTYDYDGTPTGQSTVYVSDAVQAIDGEVVQVSPTSQSAAYNGYANYSELSASLQGKYIKSSVSGYSNNVYLIPKTGTVQDNIEVVDSYRKRFTLTIDGYLVTVQTVTITETGPWEYIQSSERSAYPDSGTQDGYEYEYLGIPFDNAVGAPKIETGSYTGTGTYGSSNPNTLTFEFVPKVVLFTAIYHQPNGNYTAAYAPSMYWFGEEAFVAATGAQSTASSYSNVQVSYVFVSVNYKTMTWYSGSGANQQLNIQGATYYYIAIG